MKNIKSFKNKVSKKSYNQLPIRVSQVDFNKYISHYLSKNKRGPKPTISYYKIFNYILYVLHTGVQWNQLITYHNEIHWSNIYKHHNRWSKDGSYQRLFEESVFFLKKFSKLDLSTLYGDGSNTIAKKGAKR